MLTNISMFDRVTPVSTNQSITSFDMNQEESLRGFQPYRAGEDPGRGVLPPHFAGMDPAATASYAAAYHSGMFPPHLFAHPAFR